MSYYNGPKISTNGLVLYLDAANAKSYISGSLTWYDLSGNNNHATIYNSPAYSAASGGYFTFDGANTYMNMSSSLSLTTATPTFIVGCTNATGTVFAKGRYGSYWNYGLLNTTATTFYARNNNADVASPSFSSVSGWNVYSAAWTGTTINYYKNGVFGGSNATNYSPQNTNSLFLTIGCAQNSTPSNVEFYNGSLAFLMVYNRTLSSDEIIQNYHATKGRFGLS